MEIKIPYSKMDLSKFINKYRKEFGIPIFRVNTVISIKCPKM